MKVPICLTSLFRDVDFEKDPAYIREENRVDEFRWKGDDKIAALLLEHARRRYDDRVGDINMLEQKRWELLKLAATLATAVVAIVEAFGVPVSFSLQCSFTCFAIAMSLLVLSLRVSYQAGEASIQVVREGLAETDHPQDWLAASLHLAVVGLNAYAKCVSCHLNTARMFVLAGIICLGPNLT